MSTTPRETAVTIGLILVLLILASNIPSGKSLTLMSVDFPAIINWSECIKFFLSYSIIREMTEFFKTVFQSMTDISLSVYKLTN